jgi:hypothetical protein
MRVLMMEPRIKPEKETRCQYCAVLLNTPEHPIAIVPHQPECPWSDKWTEKARKAKLGQN